MSSEQEDREDMHKPRSSSFPPHFTNSVFIRYSVKNVISSQRNRRYEPREQESMSERQDKTTIKVRKVNENHQNIFTLKWYRQIYNNILTKKYFLIKISKITNLA